MSSFTLKLSSAKPYLKMALAVLLSCWAVFWLDHETRQISDLFSPGNLAALVIYFVPTYLLSLLLFSYFSNSSSRNSVLLSLLLGIPTGIALVICTFLFLKS